MAAVETPLSDEKSNGHARNKDNCIKIVTYNIAGNHQSFDLDKITNVLKQINGDVICLQEVSLDKNKKEELQSELIANKLRMNHVFGNAHQTKTFGNAIISKYPIHNIKKIKLPRGSLVKDDNTRMPGEKEERLALAAMISPIHNDEYYDFLCISTHLGIYNTKESSTYGKVNPAIIKQFINEYDNSTAALLCGDINAAKNNVKNPIMQEFDKKWNLNYSLNSDNTTKKHKLDWIMDRGRSKYKMISQSILNFNQTNKASDHCPLIATWQMQPKKDNQCS